MAETILDVLKQKFTSSNGVKVERITITKQEWVQLMDLINSLKRSGGK